VTALWAAVRLVQVLGLVAALILLYACLMGGWPRIVAAATRAASHKGDPP
jgi:hypothetical protein